MSEGCEWYNPDATGIEAKIRASRAEPHYIVRRDDAMYVADKVVDRRSNPKRASIVLNWFTNCKWLQEIRNGRQDFSGDAMDAKLTDEIEVRLALLGYK